MADGKEQLAVQVTTDYAGAQAFQQLQKDLQDATGALERVQAQMSGVQAKGKETGGTFSEIGKIAAGVFGGLTIEKAVAGFVEFHKTTMDTVAGLGSLADRYGITTDQLQAYQAAARSANVTDKELNTTLGTFNVAIGNAAAGNKDAIAGFEKLGVRILDTNNKLRPNTDLLTEVSVALLRIQDPAERTATATALLGEKGARLTPLLRQLTTGVGELVETYKQHGMIVSRDIIDKLDAAKNSSDAAWQGVRALYAEIGAPIQTAGMDWLAKRLGEIVTGLREARGESEKLFFALQGQQHQALLNDMAGVKSGSPAELQAQQRDELARRLAAAQNRPVPRNERFAEMRAKDINDATEALRKFDEEAEANSRRRVNAALPPPTLPPGVTIADFGRTTSGASNPTPTGTGSGKTGGGGGDSRDRIQEGLNKIAAERVAAERALEQMVSGAGVPLKDLMQQVELEKKIADEIAKLGKYDPKDPRVAQIRDEVTARETAESKLKRYTQAAQDADQVERTLGNGTAYLRETMRQLNDDLDTGRLSYEAYGVATRQAREKAEDMRLTVEGEKGGIEGLAAGMQYAANQWQRSQRTFQIGQNIVNEGFQTLKQSVVDWAQTGKFSIEKFGASMLSMIANVGFALAQSELGKLLGTGVSGSGGIINLLGGLIGGGGSGVSAVPVAGGGYSVAQAVSMAGFNTFADGGRPAPGMPSIVGEQGPELFVPDSSGTIIPNGRLGGGGGDQTVIHQTMYFGSDVNRATLATWADKVKMDTLAAVSDQKRRGARQMQVAFR